MHAQWKVVGIDLSKLDLFKIKREKLKELKPFGNKIFSFFENWFLLFKRHA